MCGITGFITAEKNASIEQRNELLNRMCESIIHRGPDEQGMIVRDRAALGMRRLSIIDLSSGQQPIFSHDENLAIVYNGEVYNFRELRSELESLGHRFKTNSDTEVVLVSYLEFGVDCVKKLRGMFAFAIWNFRDETLFVARDRVGKKPLFYAKARNGDFIFGSELKTLLVHGGVDRSIDMSALDAYLTFGYVPDDRCMVAGVKKLEAGHWLVLGRDGSIKTNSYWDFPYEKSNEIRTTENYVDAVREKISEAVRIRMVSEVPLGAFLSGGVDSSTIVSMMSRESSTPVKTFSIGFNEDTFNELKYARVAAKEFGTDHHEFIVTPDLFETLDDLVWHFDEPFADPSSLPVFMLSKMAREHVTVVLSGDGGDELFAGYNRYVVDSNRGGFAKLPRALRHSLIRPVAQMLPREAKGKNFLYNISLDPVDRYIDSVSTFNGPKRRELYSEQFSSSLNGIFESGEKSFRAIAASREFSDPGERLLYLDSKTYLVGDILTKVDRMSMASSIEARVPLLDHELIELVVRAPFQLKMNRSETKILLKKAMEGIVPDEILYRKKQGFGVPIAEWINQQLRERIITDLRSKRTIERGFFDQSNINSMIDEHARGRRDLSQELWVLWMLELWQRRYIDG